MRQKNKETGWIARFSEKIFIKQKLDNVAGYFIVALIALVFGYLLATKPFLGLGLFGFIVGTAVIIICLLNPEAGIYINITYSFFAFGFSRLFFNDEFPVGGVSDMLVVATFLGLFVSKARELQFPRSPVMAWLLVLYAYIALELFNPYAHSFQGWLLSIRKITAEFFLLYISYNVFTSRAAVRRFIIVLFVLCTLCGIYGCIQQWHGLFNYELSWVMADAHRFGLYFINGSFRKFSTMSDPTAYGVIMVTCCVFFIVLAIMLKNTRTKVILLFGSLFMLLGMSYSGTRTANAMLVSGIALFILLTIKKKSTQAFTIVATVVFLTLLYGPYSNSTINRFRTTFLGSDDASYKVRVTNKAAIRPYIHAHPIGGGLGVTGAGGLQHAPSHELAGFPPDSGYLKVALEAGWIGLAILCILYFSVLRNGIKAFFAAKSEKLRMIFAGCTAACFCLYVGQFAQDAIGQITDIVVYYPLIAITLRAKTLGELFENDLQA